MKRYLKSEIENFDELKSRSGIIEEHESMVQIRYVFGSVCEVVPVYTIYGQGEERHINSVQGAINVDGVLLCPHKKQWNKDFYVFYLANHAFDWHDWNDVSVRHHRIAKYHENTKPNAVGKPTLKKLQAWVDWLQKIEKEVCIELSKTKIVRETFMASLPDDAHIIWERGSDNKRGHIERGSLKFCFDIWDEQVNTRLEFERYNEPKSFAEFNAVADALGF